MKKIEKEGSITYIIDNDKKETYQAFAGLLENSSAMYIKKIIHKEETYQDLKTLVPDDINPEVKASNSWKIYPNPFASRINVAQSIDEQTSLQILNISGQIVQDVTINEKNSKIDLSHLKAGVYIARFKNNEAHATTIKIIKK